MLLLLSGKFYHSFLRGTSITSLMTCHTSHSAYRRVVAFGPRRDRSRDLILNLVMEKFDLSLRSTFSEGKQLRAVLQVNATVRTSSILKNIMLLSCCAENVCVDESAIDVHLSPCTYTLILFNVVSRSGEISLRISTSTCFLSTAEHGIWSRIVISDQPSGQN